MGDPNSPNHDVVVDWQLESADASSSAENFSEVTAKMVLKKIGLSAGAATSGVLLIASRTVAQQIEIALHCRHFLEDAKYDDGELRKLLKAAGVSVPEKTRVRAGYTHENNKGLR